MIAGIKMPPETPSGMIRQANQRTMQAHLERMNRHKAQA
jgi:hypothetical protein